MLYRYQTQCIAFEDIKGIQSVRIRCGDSLAEYFEKYIQSGEHNIQDTSPSTEEEKKVKKNYEFFYRKVSAVLDQLEDKSRKLAYIQDLVEKIYNLLVIDIRIESEEDAYEIFETTNARGIDLSIADLLKNLVFKKIKEEDGQDIAKELWTDIVNNIQATDTDMARFIRYYWISKYKFVSEKQLFREIKTEIKDWYNFLKDLHKASEDYNKILEGSEKDWSDIKNGEKIYKSLFALKLTRVTQCYVFILSVLRNLKKLGTDPINVIQLIEKFSFNYSAICGLPANRVERIYSRYAIDIESEIKRGNTKKTPGNIQRIFANLNTELKEANPSYEVFKDSFDDVVYKNSEQRRQLIKYILSEINYLYSSGEQLINFNAVNIEHILPQKPHKDWGLTKEEIKEYVDKLGNLVLVHEKINSIVSNKPIKEKIKELRKSELSITQKLVERLEVLNFVWTETEILKRQKN